MTITLFGHEKQERLYRTNMTSSSFLFKGQSTENKSTQNCNWPIEKNRKNGGEDRTHFEEGLRLGRHLA